MKQVLYALSNLLRELDASDEYFAAHIETSVRALRTEASKVAPHNVRRLAVILATLAEMVPNDR